MIKKPIDFFRNRNQADQNPQTQDKGLNVYVHINWHVIIALMPHSYDREAIKKFQIIFKNP